ncbi:N-acetylmuramoyl-L-alanine amidase family protein [Rhizobium wenxiniae]|uniref:N-acetylmuramoyl-L-alanine amidase family protein n=1 Tax=Rhizobium wenxiniae TaxID=1737357 RepID=UPI003C1E8ADC
MRFDTAYGALSRRQMLRSALVITALSSFPCPSMAARPTRPVVILDPGHGGRDSGAVGKNGTVEKAITLEVALRLRDELAKRNAYDVVLTREDDAFVSLIDRLSIARSHRAHLLFSIHADALRDDSVRGASVYRLSLRASDAQTNELAADHNLPISAGTRGAPEYPPGISAIMEDLIYREKQVFSFEMQRAMVAALELRVPLLTNPARSGHFLVLRSGSIPSILLEMGFLSNPEDETLLNDDEYQDRVVLASAEAISACVHRFAAAASAG